ncbi:MAG: histidine kinase, partial [Rikenellaceae bacterium]
MINRLLYSLLFSGMGVFSYLLLINFTSITSIYTLIFTLVAFNTLGHTMIRLSTWMNNKSPMFFARRKKVVIMYTTVAVILML